MYRYLLCGACALIASSPFFYGAEQAFAEEVVFISGPQNIPRGVVSDTIRIDRSQTGSLACFHLTSSSSTGQFSTNAENWSPIEVTHLNANWTGRNIFYKDTTEGTHTLTVRLAHRGSDTPTCLNWPVSEWYVLGSSTQSITVGSSSGGGTTQPGAQSNSEKDAPPSFASTNAPTYSHTPEFSVFVGGDKRVVAGASVVFEGEAEGKAGVPLKDTEARFRWSFGDGVVLHGKRVLHHFRYPGEYVVVLTVSNEATFQSASDRLLVTARPALIEIVEANPTYIELHNTDQHEIDLSRWILTDGTTAFSIPENTFFLPGRSIRFSGEVTGLSKAGIDTALLYPNTLPAVEYRDKVIEEERAGRGGATIPTSHSQTVRLASVSSPNIPLIRTTRVPPAPVSVSARVDPAENTGNTLSKTDTKDTQLASVHTAFEVAEEVENRVTVVGDQPTEFSKWLIAFFVLLIIAISIFLLYLRPENGDEDDDSDDDSDNDHQNHISEESKQYTIVH